MNPYENPNSNPYEPPKSSFPPPPVPPKTAAAQLPPLPQSSQSPSVPVPVPPSLPSPTPSSPSASTSGDAASLRDKEKALAAKEQELARREAEVVHRERVIQATLAKGDSLDPPNWPRCKPFLRHDIEKDIPPGEKRTIQKAAYFCFLATVLLIVANFVGDIILLSGGGLGTNGGQHFGVSIAYLIFGIPGALYMWYLPLYKANKSGKPREYIPFLFMFGISTCFSVFMAIGVPGLGGCGFIAMIQAFQAKDTTGGAYSIIMCALWVCLTIYSWVVLRKVYVIFKKERAKSPQEAKQEKQFMNLAAAAASTV